jgi:hypothetical protein
MPQIPALAFARTLQAAGVDAHNALNTHNTPNPQIPAPAFARTLQAGGVDSHISPNAHMNMNLNALGNSGLVNHASMPLNINHASMPLNINHSSMPLNVSAYASPFAWNGAMAHVGFYAGAPAPKDVAHSGGDGAHGTREFELLAAAANSFQRLQNHHHQPQQYHQHYPHQQQPLAPHASPATPDPHSIHSQPQQYQQQQPYQAPPLPSYTTPPCPDQHHNYQQQQQQQHQHQHQQHQHQQHQHQQHQHQHQHQGQHQHSSSIAVPSSVEDGTARGTAARLTSAARASRTNARFGQDLAAARATIIELELENTALRTALDRHRTAMREDATLRSQLEEARRARAAAEHAKNAEARQCDELRFQLRQAEAESERLRTLLAGTIWFDMKT